MLPVVSPLYLKSLMQCRVRIVFTGLFCSSAVAAALARDPEFILVDEGRARAVIVVADEANQNTLDAATALQRVVSQITGVQLPLRKAGESHDEASPIFVGMSPLVRKAGIKVAQDREGEDRYAIRVNSQRIVLAGNDAGEFRGSAFAVYDLLQRLGCGWFGPDPVYHVIPHHTTLTVEPLCCNERPAFRHRNIWMVKDRVLQDAWRLGGCHFSHGHALDRWVPPKVYAEKHPEYFGPRQEQPCLTHPEVLEIVVKGLRNELDHNPGKLSLSLCANDSKVYCECDRCKGIGNISARTLNFVNGVARELAKSHPHRYLLTIYAYWLANEPPQPMLKAEPGVCVMQVNEGDHMRPWDQPEPKQYCSLEKNDNNYRELTAFAGWRKTGAIMAIYEWWIPGCSKDEWKSVPWYSGETALRNLRYWKQHDVQFVSYESGYENGNGFPIRWPLYYVGARGMWNPKLTAKQIMTGACEKLYGPAAQPMLRFYEIIEKSVAEAPPNIRGFGWNLPSAEKIFLPAIEAAATAELEEAEATPADADVKKRIAQERAMWENARAALAKVRAEKKAKASQKPNDDYKP